ncbi:MAG: hypothetical protein H6716_20175 [Polyangiaceae bacterium]|nr:hypothetical protein [Polyangiaceae bacterium]
MTRRVWPIVALLWLAASSAVAQSLEPLSFVRGEAYAEATELGASPDVRYGSRSLSTRLRFPLLLDGKNTILLPGFAYQRLKLSSAGGPDGEHSLALQAPVTEVGLVHRVGERWLTGGFLTAGLASDFAGSVSRDDWSIVGPRARDVRAGRWRQRRRDVGLRPQHRGLQSGALDAGGLDR